MGGPRRDRQPRPLDDGRMPLVEHLLELRTRLGRALLGIAACAVVVFVFWEPVFDLLRQPYCDTEPGRRSCDLYAPGIFDQFAVRLRVALIGGVLASSPIWLYQLGAFITPALHRKERRYAAGFLAASLTLFVAGAAFAFLTVSKGLDFLLSVGGDDIVTLVTVRDYLGFLTLCLVAFGIAFEFPVVVLFLHLVGAFPAEQMQRYRRYVVLGVFVASALLTPSQDPITFLAMAVPVCLLYEVCVLVARTRERLRRRRQGDDPLAGLDDDEASPRPEQPSPL